MATAVLMPLCPIGGHTHRCVGPLLVCLLVLRPLLLMPVLQFLLPPLHLLPVVVIAVVLHSRHWVADATLGLSQVGAADTSDSARAVSYLSNFQPPLGRDVVVICLGEQFILIYTKYGGLGGSAGVVDGSDAQKFDGRPHAQRVANVLGRAISIRAIGGRLHRNSTTSNHLNRRAPYFVPYSTTTATPRRFTPAADSLSKVVPSTVVRCVCQDFGQAST